MACGLGDTMGEDKPKRKVTDYAGIAALITAIATCVGMLWNQSNQQETNKLTQESMFAIMDYRLKLVEQVCGVPTPYSSGKYVPPVHHARPVLYHPLHGRTIEAATVTRPRPDKKRDVVPASYDKLQQFIQKTGKPWVPNSVPSLLHDSSSDSSTD